MAFLQKIRDFLLPPATEEAPVEREAPFPDVVRRWDGAATDRLNEAHWENVTGNPINTDLQADLETLRARCHYEYSNNPIVEGIVETHAIDQVGPTGPTLQVQSDDENYNRTLEQIWSWWWAEPEIKGTMTGNQLLHQWAIAEWLDGPILSQIVTDEDAHRRNEPLTMRLLDLAAQRLVSPLDSAADPSITLGVRRNRRGIPTQYFISRQDPSFPNDWRMSLETDPVPPVDIIHEFRGVEAGQVTGYPRLASTLQDIADIRDHDLQVLDGLRSAADTGTYFVATAVAAEQQYQRMEGTSTIKRRTERFVPPGYTPHQMQPGQPTPESMNFRREKIRAIGRPAHMPLLLIQLSADDANFSQSRIDINVLYERGLNCIRRDRETRILNRLVNLVAREAELARILPARQLPRTAVSQNLRRLADVVRQHSPPLGVIYKWGWDPLPPANSKEQATSREIQIRTGQRTLHSILAQDGIPYDTHMAEIRGETADRVQVGLPPLAQIQEPDSDPPPDESNTADEPEGAAV